jgi:outer membrane receptor for Fe3+-dicitrate
MASVSAILIVGIDTTFARDEETNVQNLPPIEVSPPRTAATREQPRTTGGRARLRTAAQIASPAPPKQQRYIYPTAPGPGSGIDVDKIPASINAVDANQIRRTRSPDIAVSLQQYVPGLSINEVTGNPFQPDIQFRGFVASPLAGTPQGLAVYQNGVRINEAFADIVNWDLIPTAAIRSAIVVTNNPAFGLNALGGAIDLQMKNGFNYQGAEIDVMGGSFGRLYGSAQWGKKVDSN